MAIRLLALVVLVLAVTACTARGAQQDAEDDVGNDPGSSESEIGSDGDSTVLRTAYQADIGSFDPDNNFEVAGLGAINAVYEGLVEYEPESTELTGLLAESWEVSDDGTTYTFDLRDDVTFHDGEPMDAQAVMTSFERRQSEDLALSYFLFNVEGMDAPDEDTFVLTLGMPQPSLLDNLASPWGPKVVSPRALADNAGDDNAQSFLNENAVGTGPYELTEFSRGQQYVLTRFDEYWGDAPHFGEIDIAVQADIGQQVLQLQNGDLDVVLHGYPFQQLDDLPEGVVEFTYNDLGLEMAYVNTHGVLADEELRGSVVAAANPEGWISDAFSGRAEPAKTLYPQAMLTPDEPWQWPKVDDVSDAPDIQVVYTAEEAAVQQRVADLLVTQLAASGISATARSAPQEEVLSWVEDPENAPADIVLAQNNPDSAHPETVAGLFYASGGPLNVFGYSNEEADALFNEGFGAEDIEERDALYDEGGRIIFEDGAFIPLADVQDIIVHRDGLTNLNPRPAIPWNIDFGTVSAS